MTVRSNESHQTLKLNKSNCIRILSELQRVCDRVSPRLGCRFNIEHGEICKDGTVLYSVRCHPGYLHIDERAAFVRRHKEYSFEAWMLDAVFEFRGKKYRVAGLRPLAKVNPVVCEIVGTGEFKQLSVFVASLLRKQNRETKTI